MTRGVVAVEADVVISGVVGRKIEVRVKPPPVLQRASPQAAGVVEAASAADRLNAVDFE